MQRFFACMLFAAACVFSTTSAARATLPLTPASRVYGADLQPLNGTAVQGHAYFSIGSPGEVAYAMHATGLEPNVRHSMQIRGFKGSSLNASVPPATAAGTDGVMNYDEATAYLGQDKLL